MPDNKYADVILPLALPKAYTFVIPDELIQKTDIGKRVIVQFGKRRIYTALVKSVHSNKPEGYDIKPVMEVLDEKPVIQSFQLDFWEWIAGYYMCTLGEIYKAALPSGLKLESETKVCLTEEAGFRNLLPDEDSVVKLLLNEGTLSLNQIASFLNKKSVIPVIKSLALKEIVQIDEVLKKNYKPKSIDYIKLSDDYLDEKKLNHLLNKLSRAPKQIDILMSFLALSDYHEGNVHKEVKKSLLLDKAGASSASLKGLIDKQVFQIYSKEISRFESEDDSPLKEKVNLNASQQKALQNIKDQFETNDVVLLHGVTSSGKTEIYIHLIEEQLQKGRQVLYLLPEIALTTQIITRLKNIFGEKTGVYHSKFSDNERVEVWNNLLGIRPENMDEYDIILGVRSSVFLPFSRLGLVIVDEEHENTYKQYDPSPRYHARDTSVVLAKMLDAKVLLGTATPSVETYFNVQQGKYGMVELNERYLEIALPEISVVDILLARKQKKMQTHFSHVLSDTIQNALEKKEQIILFQNRRGFAPYLECDVCGWIPHCKHCDVSLTYHKTGNRLVCHYCGYTLTNLRVCSSCGSTAMKTCGFGTEKVEDEVSIMFPEAKTARLDLDSAKSRRKYEKIISDFEQGDIDILIGTQMITKGLDFKNVSVVGILNADNMLNFPDFRSYERSYQLMTQVSGRAGRKKGQGLVIIQTNDTENPVIRYVLHNDYNSMFTDQLNEREAFKYPPFYRLIKLSVKHKKPEIMDKASRKLATDLQNIKGVNVIGPEFPLIGKIQSYYVKCIMLKIPRSGSLKNIKELISSYILNLLSDNSFKSVIVQTDVDPY